MSCMSWLAMAHTRSHIWTDIWPVRAIREANLFKSPEAVWREKSTHLNNSFSHGSLQLLHIDTEHADGRCYAKLYIAAWRRRLNVLNKKVVHVSEKSRTMLELLPPGERRNGGEGATKFEHLAIRHILHQPPCSPKPPLEPGIPLAWEMLIDSAVDLSCESLDHALQIQTFLPRHYLSCICRHMFQNSVYQRRIPALPYRLVAVAGGNQPVTAVDTSSATPINPTLDRVKRLLGVSVALGRQECLALDVWWYRATFS